jgi:sarcosine oxidase subunit alpha
MHAWHSRNGAQILEVDGWRQVLSYGDSDSELKACQASVGICDATPMAKMDLQGRGAAEFFSRLFEEPAPAIHCVAVLHRQGTQILAARLRADRMLLLSAAEERGRLLANLSNAAGNHCVHVNDLTSALAAVRVVGPRTLPLLKKMTSAQVEALHRDGCLQAAVARIPATLVRSDFGTQRGWLLLASRDYGAYLWQCLLSAGHEFGIQPIGLVAERRMAGQEVSGVATV